MSTVLKSSKCTIKIRTHGMRWVKKHCEYHEYWTVSRYAMPGKMGILWAPNMNQEICGKSFTVVTVRKDFVYVEETDYGIPFWLLTEASQRRSVRWLQLHKTT